MLGEDTVFPFQMQRKQFPIRLAFGITCNKSQGQSLSACGIKLDRPFFSHGQLYVTLSRVGNLDNLKILTRNACFDGHDGYYTDNVVYTLRCCVYTLRCCVYTLRCCVYTLRCCNFAWEGQLIHVHIAVLDLEDIPCGICIGRLHLIICQQ